ncbi:unnamed protein product [Euphydryas editha]|uniref:Major facilitator superfamily (MFS) profile domain-containing protein n=1 Tax=Euphydryas editha TaxID=104508 RepID=A0AAU9UFW0_EUPED|nr:unnamed protein product [Euphydryas editha]
MTWTEELDEATVLATRKGYWHIVLFYLLCGLAAIPTSFLVFSQVFINATPKHWCAPPPELEGLDLPIDLLRNLTVPGKHEENEACNSYSLDREELYTALDDYIIERSKIIKVGDTITTLKRKEFVAAFGVKERKEQLRRVQEVILSIRREPTTCPHGWQFSTEHYKSTLVTEFSLVCDRDWLPRTSNTLFWVGSIFGNLFFGWFSDRYGRRPTILLMILLEVPLAIAASFPGNYWTYIALRVAGGLFFPALYQLPFILALELMPPCRRTYTGINNLTLI